MKILSPAGNFECLKAAIYNGADEVYLGINNICLSRYKQYNFIYNRGNEVISDKLLVISY